MGDMNTKMLLVFRAIRATFYALWDAETYRVSVDTCARRYQTKSQQFSVTAQKAISSRSTIANKERGEQRAQPCRGVLWPEARSLSPGPLRAPAGSGRAGRRRGAALGAAMLYGRRMPGPGGGPYKTGCGGSVAPDRDEGPGTDGGRDGGWGGE